ncbi:hypothetical protein HMPREF0972_00188 [Actinomyces sp. oral taxon 848 str. F0332]|nr:hypothetical protein HMPREF0972_00188 [Actinomyces sp. oral taxon 848 str. F0332]
MTPCACEPGHSLARRAPSPSRRRASHRVNSATRLVRHISGPKLRRAHTIGD